MHTRKRKLRLPPLWYHALESGAWYRQLYIIASDKVIVFLQEETDNGNHWYA